MKQVASFITMPRGM